MESLVRLVMTITILVFGIVIASKIMGWKKLPGTLGAGVKDRLAALWLWKFNANFVPGEPLFRQWDWHGAPPKRKKQTIVAWGIEILIAGLIDLIVVAFLFGCWLEKIVAIGFWKHVCVPFYNRIIVPAAHWLGFRLLQVRLLP